MRFINRIGQGWRDKGQRIASVSLTIVMLSAVAVAVFACFGSEVLAAWKTPGNAEQALTSGGTLAELLNFEAPAQTVARLKTQTQEAKQSHALAHLAVELKNWKNTSLLSTLVGQINIVKILINQFLNPPYLILTLSPFTPNPPAFVPRPFTGNIHSLAQVAAYNQQSDFLLILDKLNDRTQRDKYQSDVYATYNAALLLNTVQLAYALRNINALGFAAAASAASPFISAAILGVVFGADAVVVERFIGTSITNVYILAEAYNQANAVLDQHLAGEVFKPLVAATPYR